MAVEPVTKLDDAPLAFGQLGECPAQRLAAQLQLDRLFGKRIVAGDEISQDGVLRLAHRGVEAGRRAGCGPHFVYLLQRERRLLGDLVERRLPPELGPERSLRPVHLLHPLDDVHRHADRPRFVGQRPRDCLADPPRGVGGELEAAPPVELLDSADQAERSLLDQVEEGQPLVAVVLRDRDDESQV